MGLTQCHGESKVGSSVIRYISNKFITEKGYGWYVLYVDVGHDS